MNGTSRLSALLAEYAVVKRQRDELLEATKPITARWACLRSDIEAEMLAIGSSGYKDDSTKTSSSFRTSSKWQITNQDELAAAIAESPYLREELVKEKIDTERATELAATGLDIPGLELVESRTLYITVR